MGRNTESEYGPYNRSGVLKLLPDSQLLNFPCRHSAIPIEGGFLIFGGSGEDFYNDVWRWSFNISAHGTPFALPSDGGLSGRNVGIAVGCVWSSMN